jgi:transposase
MSGDTPAELRRWMLDPPVSPVSLRLPKAAADPPLGQGFEVSVSRTWTDPQTGQVVTWDERVLVLRSDKLARRQQRGLADRLARAERALRQVKAKPNADPQAMNAETRTILERHNVSDYLKVTWTPYAMQTKRYLKRGRHGPQSPCEIVTTTTWRLTLKRQVEAIETFERLAGWRLYVTNAPAQRLDLAGAVACYREQWQPERNFHRLKGVPLAIRPLLLQSDVRIGGLLQVLVIALRVLTLFEFVARRNLE